MILRTLISPILSPKRKRHRSTMTPTQASAPMQTNANAKGAVRVPQTKQPGISFLLACSVSKMEKLKTYQERHLKYILHKSGPE